MSILHSPVPTLNHFKLSFAVFRPIIWGPGKNIRVSDFSGERRGGTIWDWSSAGTNISARSCLRPLRERARLSFDPWHTAISLSPRHSPSAIDRSDRDGHPLLDDCGPFQSERDPRDWFLSSLLYGFRWNLVQKYHPKQHIYAETFRLSFFTAGTALQRREARHTNKDALDPLPHGCMYRYIQRGSFSMDMGLCLTQLSHIQSDKSFSLIWDSILLGLASIIPRRRTPVSFLDLGPREHPWSRSPGAAWVRVLFCPIWGINFVTHVNVDTRQPRFWPTKNQIVLMIDFTRDLAWLDSWLPVHPLRRWDGTHVNNVNCSCASGLHLRQFMNGHRRKQQVEPQEIQYSRAKIRTLPFS